MLIGPLLPHHPGARHRWIAGSQAQGPRDQRHPAHPHPAVRRPGDRRHRHRRRPHLLPGAGARTDPRAPLAVTEPMTAMTATPRRQAHRALRRCAPRHSASKSIFDPSIVKTAIVDSFKKLNPRTMMRNPVMFIVEVGSVLTTYLVRPRLSRQLDAKRTLFAGLVAAWLWFTVLFANFAEAMAEGRGKAQADALRKTRADTTATLRSADGTIDGEAVVRSSCSVTCASSRRRGHPRRWRHRRGHRHRRRVGHHRRVGSGHSRVGRRPLGGHRRYPGAQRRDRRARSPRSRARPSSIG